MAFHLTKLFRNEKIVGVKSACNFIDAIETTFSMNFDARRTHRHCDRHSRPKNRIAHYLTLTIRTKLPHSHAKPSSLSISVSLVELLRGVSREKFCNGTYIRDDHTAPPIPYIYSSKSYLRNRFEDFSASPRMGWDRMGESNKFKYTNKLKP